MQANLQHLEDQLAAGDAAMALACVIDILAALDRSYGATDGLEGQPSQLDLDEDERLTRFATRFCAGLAQIMANPRSLSEDEYGALVVHHRWIDLLFTLSGFKSAEHVMPGIFRNPREPEPAKLRRFLSVFPTSVSDSLDFDQCARVDSAATYSALLHYAGSRYCFRPPAYNLRERVLEWLPGKLADAELPGVSPRMLVEPYMHCSYATTPRKHDIKADIIAQMRRACLRGGCPELAEEPRQRSDKPVIIVTTEAFGVGHSVYRTHSRSVRSLRERFHVVGLCFAASLSPETQSCFDEVMLYPGGDFVAGIRSLAEQILARGPDMMLQLGVGMAPQTIALASLRLVPIQVASFAHTATSNSRFVDHMILPSDFVRAREAFAEPLLMVPPEAMPYALRSDGAAASAEARKPGARTGGAVRIGLPASIMKHNPRLFDALARITQNASRPTEFHLFPLGSVGVARLALERSIKHANVVVHPELAYPDYLQRLGACDFFVCPFPYGNVNSIVDCVRLGLPGVCLDGDQPHAHADASLFRRAGLPEDLITQTVEDYVAAAVRLVDDGAWLAHCRERALAADLLSPAFNGDASLFCTALAELLRR